MGVQVLGGSQNMKPLKELRDLNLKEEEAKIMVRKLEQP